MSPPTQGNEDSWLSFGQESKDIRSARLASIIKWRDSTEKARPTSSLRKSKKASPTFLDESDPPNFDPSWTSWLESPTPEPAEIQPTPSHKQQQHQRQQTPQPSRSSSAPTPMMDVQYSSPPLKDPQQRSHFQHDATFAVQEVDCSRTTLYTMYESSSTTHTQPSARRPEPSVMHAGAPPRPPLRQHQQQAGPVGFAGAASRSHSAPQVRYEGRRPRNNSRKRGSEGRMSDQPGCKRYKER